RSTNTASRWRTSPRRSSTGRRHWSISRSAAARSRRSWRWTVRLGRPRARMAEGGRRQAIPAGFVALGLVVAVGLAAVAGLVAVGILSLPSSSPVALGAPHFTDETSTAGIDHAFATQEEIGVGGGVATFDCNADGLPDLYLAGGTGPAMLARNDST